KTDRLDAEGMLHVLATWLGGDRRVCSMVRVPTPEEEDAKRPHREREHLVQERLRIENRIEALLFTQGIRGRPSLRSWERDMAELRTGDGRKLPPLLRAELERLRRRLVLTLELIREMETERDEALTVTSGAAATQKVTALQRIRGIGPNFAAILVCEVLYRSFANRRQLASYVGIAPMPYQSGGIDRDRSISRAGNPRARTTLIQLAWLIGSCPRMVRDNRHDSAYLFGAICPARAVGAAIIMPAANAEAMNKHLTEISTQVASGAHAVVVCDKAGWHQTGRRLRVPDNITLLPLPSYAPELNPMENVWEYLRGNKLSRLVWDGYDAIVAACREAWHFLINDPDRIRSIGHRH